MYKIFLFFKFTLMIIPSFLYIFYPMTIGDFEPYPVWFVKNNDPENGRIIIEKPKESLKLNFFKKGRKVWFINSDLSIKRRISLKKDELIETVPGIYNYIIYKKFGNFINFFSADGELYWELPSLEYPYFSQTGNYIALLRSENSSIRIIDRNMNFINKHTTEDFITDFSFSNDDYFAVSYLSSKFSIFSDKGKIIVTKRIHGFPLKSIKFSPNHRYLALYTEVDNSDLLIIYDSDQDKYLRTKKTKEPFLEQVLPYKVQIFWNRDSNKVYLINNNCLIAFKIKKNRFYIVNKLQLKEISFKISKYYSMDFNQLKYIALVYPAVNGAFIRLYNMDLKEVYSKKISDNYGRVFFSKNGHFITIQGEKNSYCIRIS